MVVVMLMMLLELLVEVVSVYKFKFGITSVVFVCVVCFRGLSKVVVILCMVLLFLCDISDVRLIKCVEVLFKEFSTTFTIFRWS